VKRMSDEKSPVSTMIDAHEEWLGRMDSMASKTRWLSAGTVLIAALLALGFALQLAQPLLGNMVVTVNLSDPVLEALQVILLVLVLAWLYVGLSFYRFASRLSRQVAKAHEEEDELGKRITQTGAG